jgi:hypothetical protein
LFPACCFSRAALSDTSAILPSNRSIIVQIQQRHFHLGQALAGILLSVFAQTAGVLTLVQAL